MNERIFNENEAAEFLSTELRLRIKPSTLRAKRRTGGGPVFARPMNAVEYSEADLRSWAEGLRAAKYRNTAEASVRALA